MTYNEWRDELKSNLLSVSESERRRVLDYYAEAYADRRDAGFTEREIIEDFGAPYDAAQRILAENRYGDNRGYYDEPADDYSRRERRREEKELRQKDLERMREERERERERALEERERAHEERKERYEKRNRVYDEYEDDGPLPESKNKKKSRGENYTWVFVLLCIIFAVPLFGLIMSMVGISIGLCVAPFAVVISGAISVVTGIISMFSSLWNGLYTLGTGLILLGVGVMLISVFPRMVKLMWKLFTKFFSWLKSLFSGKEA